MRLPSEISIKRSPQLANFCTMNSAISMWYDINVLCIWYKYYLTEYNNKIWDFYINFLNFFKNVENFQILIVIIIITWFIYLINLNLLKLLNKILYFNLKNIFIFSFIHRRVQNLDSKAAILLDIPTLLRNAWKYHYVFSHPLHPIYQMICI